MHFSSQEDVRHLPTASPHNFQRGMDARMARNSQSREWKRNIRLMSVREASSFCHARCKKTSRWRCSRKLCRSPAVRKALERSAVASRSGSRAVARRACRDASAHPASRSNNAKSLLAAVLLRSHV
eukprot:6175135-Pleurochrysis_carterae.AAC.1